MKLVKLSLVAVALAAVSSAALAAAPGAYVGAGIGYGRLEQANAFPKGSVPNTVSTSQQKGNVAGRAFVGYNINQNFGVEAGYNYFGDATVKASSKSVPNANFKYTNQIQTGDLVGKAYLPISDSGFNLYALGGAAYVHSNEKASGTVLKSSTTSTNKVRPKYGIGASYDIPNSPVTTSLELSRVQGTGDKSSIPNVDSAMFTVSYTFDGTN